MISEYDKKLLTEAGREYLSNVVSESKVIKEKLSFAEQRMLYEATKRMPYEHVIRLVVTEDIRAFEKAFGKFLKYSVAAIAGMKWIPGMKGPAVAMFILYLYRKMSDTCVRSCFSKLPLSNDRKICKYECQLNAAKKMANDLRSEISKCSQFEYAEKCEKKLQGEYIKWAKRVQALTVKLNMAKVGREEKARKARQKELAKSAKTLAASYRIKDVSGFISENKIMREKLTFKQQLFLYDLLKEEGEIVKPPKINPKNEKRFRTALYLGLWVLPIPFFNDFINYIVKKYDFSCVVKCTKQRKFSGSICRKQCAYLSAKYAVDTLKQQMGKCNKAKNPTKCKKSILKLQSDWRQREVERKIKFESALRGEIAKAKRKNAKMGNI
jgi:hypothetical protein